jgi:hypothetical protein
LFVRKKVGVLYLGDIAKYEKYVNVFYANLVKFN